MDLEVAATFAEGRVGGMPVDAVLRAALPLNSLVRELSMMPRVRSTTGGKKGGKGTGIDADVEASVAKAGKDTKQVSPTIVGSVIRATVSSTRPYGLILDTEDGCVAIALNSNLPGGGEGGEGGEEE